jgi:hypothetical protein
MNKKERRNVSLSKELLEFLEADRPDIFEGRNFSQIIEDLLKKEFWTMDNAQQKRINEIKKKIGEMNMSIKQLENERDFLIKQLEVAQEGVGVNGRKN